MTTGMDSDKMPLRPGLATTMNATEPVRILVIDDDELTLAILRKLLEAENYEVDMFMAASEALAKLSQNHYDAILCDMWMSGMNGKEFYQEVKKDFPEYQRKLIFVTGDLASEATWEFIDERHLPYVLKPFSRSELQRKVREIVGDRAAVAQLEANRRAAEGGVQRRRHRRTAMKASIKVSRKKWAVGGPDVGTVVNASKGGVFFVTDRPYRVGLDVLATFPYAGSNDIEQDGFVVRVENLPDGRLGVAIALDEDAAIARAAFEGSKEDTRRHHILSMPDSTILAPPELEAEPTRDQEDARRLGAELVELRTKHDEVIDQRDRLAAEEARLAKQLQELNEAKAAMTQVLDQVKGKIDTLQEQIVTTDEIRYQATHDALTGLWNRGSILDILKRELLRAQREGTTVGVIMADLDHFKNVNDTYGHLAGDDVLREAAQRINAAVRSYDAVGRYGGEEFLIVLPGCEEDPVRQAGRIRESVCAEPVKTLQGLIAVTASLGATSSDGLQEIETILNSADMALYRAKRGGRNRVEHAIFPNPLDASDN